jgi:hypothetical protein
MFHDSASVEKDVSPRRSFLRQTLSTGVGIMLASASVAANPVVETTCGRPSAAESLLMYLGMVNLVLSEAFAGIHRRVTTKLINCERLYADLYKLLEDLCVELSRSRQSTSQNRQIEDLVKAGRASLRIVQANLDSFHQDASPALAALSLVSQQVCLQAQTLLPPNSEARLSRTATDILRNILDLINGEDFKELYRKATLVPQQQTPNPNEEATVANDLINNKLLKFIGEARAAIVEAENPTPTDENLKARTVDRPMQWSIADARLKDALQTLKDLVTPRTLVTVDGEKVTRALVSTKLPDSFIRNLPDNVMSKDPLADVPNVDTELTPADGLILTLGGTRRLIQKPEYRKLSFQPKDNNNNQARYISVVDRVEPVPDRLDAISGLLWRYCPPGYADDASRCEATVLFVDGWDTWIPEFLRVSAIRAALYGAERFGQIACVGRRNFGALARELARL